MKRVVPLIALATRTCSALLRLMRNDFQTVQTHLACSSFLDSISHI